MSWADMQFDAPWPVALALVLVLPLLVLSALAWERRRRLDRLARYASVGALPRLGARPHSRKGRVGRLVAVAALCAIALAGPRWGILSSQETRRGIDVAMALDASLSMLAEDERPSRLERMKQEVRRLRAQSRADRIALIAFAGRSYILSPLTSDDGALELYLENLSPDVVGQGGSSIARAIRQGTELLAASNGTSDRALVIMSDGEAFEPEEDVRAAAMEAAEQGVVLVAVGFGTLDGGTIPERVGNRIVEKRDQDGKIVVTKYVPGLLEAAAEASGGVFIPSGTTDRAGRVRAALSSLRTERRAISSREDHVARFAWFLVPALALLLLDTWLAQRVVSRRPSGREKASRMTAGEMPRVTHSAVLILALGSLIGACARAPDPAQLFAEGDIEGALAAYQEQIAAGDTSFRTRYNLATTLLVSDSLAAANGLLEPVMLGTDGELRGRATYNAGLSRLIEGRGTSGDTANAAFAAARTLLRRYLGERYDDEDAKWNYELALRPQPPMGGGGGGGDDDDPSDPNEGSPQGGQLDQSQAEALLNSAARDERDVQGRQQKMTRVPPPRGGRDW